MPKKKEKAKGPTVKVRCVMCKATKEIGPGEVKPGDHPMCEKDFMPMVPVEARA